MAALIPLSRGLFAAVDDADAPDLLKHRWYAIRPRPGHFYAGRFALAGGGKKSLILMHRQLLAAPIGMDVDHHPDPDGLNNQRGNLRLATRCGNSQNRKMHRNNSTGYKGVSRDGKKFVAQICANRVQRVLGRFDTAEEAYAAYCAAALELHGEFARVA